MVRILDDAHALAIFVNEYAGERFAQRNPSSAKAAA
jgi:hypothetical protein